MAAQRILESDAAWHNPLRQEGGVLRVGNSRVSFDSLVYAYQDGETAEEIALHFPTLHLQDIYAAILLYLIGGTTSMPTSVAARMIGNRCGYGGRSHLTRMHLGTGFCGVDRKDVDSLPRGRKPKVHDHCGSAAPPPKRGHSPAVDAGLAGAEDSDVLELAAAEGRVLVTHDVSTMQVHAMSRVERELSMPGAIEVPERHLLRAIVEDLILISEAAMPGDLENRIIFLPL